MHPAIKSVYAEQRHLSAQQHSTEPSLNKNSIHNLATAAVVAFTLGSGVAFGQSQVGPSSSEYDYDAINKNIAEATSAVVESSAVLESAVVTVDGNVTNLAEDVYKVDKSIVLKKAPWSPSKLSIDVAVKANMKRNENPKRGSLLLEADAKVETDTLAMVKFMNAKKLKRCAERVESGLKRIMQKHACDLAEGVSVAGTLGDVARSLSSSVAGEKADLEAFVKRAKASVAIESNEMMRAEGVKLLDKAKRKLHALESVKVEALEDGLNLSLEHLNTSHAGFKLKSLKVSLTPEVAEVSANGSLRMPTMLYDAFKPEVAYMLKGLEEGREFALEHVAAHARLRERLLAAMVNLGSRESIGAQSAEQQHGEQGAEQLPVQLTDESGLLESLATLQSIGLQVSQN